MAMKESLFKSALTEIDHSRQKAILKSQQTREQIYERIPRILEIDKALAAGSLRMAASVLDGGDPEKAITSLKEQSQALIAERDSLLKRHKLGKNALIPQFACAICEDTGFVGFERCACLKRKLIDKYYQAAGLCHHMDTEHFDNFQLSYYSDQIDGKFGLSPRDNMKRVWMSALNFVKNFDQEFSNLLMYGDTGLGKTFLCNCIAKELLDQGKTVFYVTAAVMFKAVENLRFHPDDDQPFEETVDMLTDADLLIIDDLGTEFATIVTSSELFNVINIRLLGKKPTIISTNLSTAALTEQYTDRLTSRIIGHFTLLKFFGEDIRIKKKYNML